VASRTVLGADAGAFEAALRASLFSCRSDGRFGCVQRFGFTLGRKVREVG
jgi:hypothetical protein